ncbi:hypothetical protein PHMEG_00026201 [Phytophthora megakarya]|uniref:Reverse transcriptase zinc-binding domain-containing protein n=1 Tax=Phytophthora megakarya TaxID=4795 RepID=A0A225V934_9STRA|nr:hypothetical protein PHMEG_00026201 [Phytophthora megakarya]
MQQAFEGLAWSDIRRITGLHGWGEQLLYRLKVRGLRFYLKNLQRPGCPLPTCGSSQISRGHVFWDCPFARELWKVFVETWKRTGLSIDIDISNTVSTFTLVSFPRSFADKVDSIYKWIPRYYKSRF